MREKPLKIIYEKQYIALLCKLCGSRVPKEYEVKSPKEILGKVMPLVKTSLAVIGTVNSIAKLGSCLGIPSLDSKSINDVGNYWEKLSASDVESYPRLQDHIQSAYETSEEDQKKKQSLRDQGYCVSQFQRWLKEVDPKETWKDELHFCCAPHGLFPHDSFCFVCNVCYESR